MPLLYGSFLCCVWAHGEVHTIHRFFELFVFIFTLIGFTILYRQQDIANITRSCVAVEVDIASGERYHVYDIYQNRGVKNLPHRTFLFTS